MDMSEPDRVVREHLLVDLDQHNRGCSEYQKRKSAQAQTPFELHALKHQIEQEAVGNRVDPEHHYPTHLRTPICRIRVDKSDQADAGDKEHRRTGVLEPFSRAFGELHIHQQERWKSHVVPLLDRQAPRHREIVPHVVLRG